ncbi:MAG: tetratricopeptide repeat protein [candidate division KSB1 bacterium]|nr:tetratricopeptide repeat protein [candidate division KSB1 bacterium]
MIRYQKLFILCLVVFMAVSAGYGAQERKKVIQGNDLFEQEKYDAALDKYRDALTSNPESPLIEYNIGASEYRKQNMKPHWSSLKNL